MYKRQIERPTSGSIVINGQNLAALRKSAIPYLRRKLGLIFQDQKLLFDRSVLDNVLLPLSIVGHPVKDAPRRAQAALAKVGLPNRAKACLLYTSLLPPAARQASAKTRRWRQPRGATG